MKGEVGTGQANIDVMALERNQFSGLLIAVAVTLAEFRPQIFVAEKRTFAPANTDFRLQTCTLQG